MNDMAVTKILMLAPEPFFEPRGTPISILQRLEACAALGYQVDLLTYHVGQDVVLPGLRIIRTPSVPFIRSVRIGPSWAKLVLDFLLFWQALWLLLRNRYDIVHTHEEGAFIARFLAPLFRVPHLYDMHSHLSRQLAASAYGRWRPAVWLFESLERQVIRRCQGVITIGSDLDAFVYSINPSVVHSRVENLAVLATDEATRERVRCRLAERFDLARRRLVVYTGSFERYQGFDLLLASSAIIIRRFPEALFVIVGGRDDQVTAHKRAVAGRGLEDHFFFPGRVPLVEASVYLELAEVLVSPRTEGLSIPLKIYSYLGAGKPIVATRLVAHTQILDDNIALLTDVDAPAFAAGIIRLLEDRNLQRELGRAARDYAAATYEPEAYYDKMRQVYEALKNPRTALLTFSEPLKKHRSLSNAETGSSS